MAGNGSMTMKLLLNSRDFDSNLKKSKKQVSEFEKVGQEMGGKLVKSFGQLAGAMLAIKGAGDAFKAVINSSQATSDAFASTIATTKTVTDNFIYSLANADFTVFNNGLDDMISKAREAYNAMDQLGNTRMSVDYLMATSGADYKKAMVNARDKSLSVEERSNWLKIAEQEMANLVEGQQTIERDAMETIKTRLAAQTGVDKYFISEEAIKNALLVDSRSTNVKDRAEIKSQYEALNKQFSDIMNRAIEENTVSTTSSMGGTVVTKSKGYEEAVASAQRTIEHLKTENADLIVSYDLLFRETDQGLQEVINTAKSAIAAQNQISEMTTSHNEVANSINTQAKQIHTATQNLEQERVALEQEQQALFDAVKYGAPVTTMQMGIKFDNSDINKDYQLGQLVSGKPIKEYRDANPYGDLPETVAELDEKAMSEKSFGGDEHREKFVANMNAMSQSAEILQGVLSLAGQTVDDDTQKLLAFIGSVLESVQAVMKFISTIVAETAARRANQNAAVGEASAKAMAAHAGIPFAGVAMGIAAVASIISTIQSIPQFAEGGIVTSATLGVFGEAGPEAVMPLDRLNDFIRDREVRVTGTIVGQGKDLCVIIDNYNRVRNVKS